MPKPCSICQHPDRATIDGELAAGLTGSKLASQRGLSVASVYRHIRAGHAPGAPTPVPMAERGPSVPAEALPQSLATPEPDRERSLAMREARRLRLEAWKNVQEARKAGDIKATNGAIASATKTQEHLGELRGVIRRGSQVNVAQTVNVVAVEQHAIASQMDTGDVTALAEAHLTALAESGDALALAVIGRLVRLLRSAEPVPDGTPLSRESSAA